MRTSSPAQPHFQRNSNVEQMPFPPIAEKKEERKSCGAGGAKPQILKSEFLEKMCKRLEAKEDVLMVELKGHFVEACKDQTAARFIQNVFESTPTEVKSELFEEMVPSLLDLS